MAYFFWYNFNTATLVHDLEPEFVETLGKLKFIERLDAFQYTVLKWVGGVVCIPSLVFSKFHDTEISLVLGRRCGTLEEPTAMDSTLGCPTLDGC